MSLECLGLSILFSRQNLSLIFSGCAIFTLMSAFFTPVSFPWATAFPDCPAVVAYKHLCRFPCWISGMLTHGFFSAALVSANYSIT